MESLPRTNLNMNFVSVCVSPCLRFVRIRNFCSDPDSFSQSECCTKRGGVCEFRIKGSFTIFCKNAKSNPGKKIYLKCSVADPGSGAFLTPGSGIQDGKIIRIRDEHPRSIFRELRNRFFWGLKYLFDADPDLVSF